MDRAKAIEALPALLPEKAAEREHALEIIDALFESRERTEGEVKRLAEVRSIFHGSGPSRSHGGGKLKLIGGQ
jgi:hypothetical protein